MRLFKNARSKVYLTFALGTTEGLGEQRTAEIILNSVDEIARRYGLDAGNNLSAVLASVSRWLQETKSAKRNNLLIGPTRSVQAEDHEIYAAFAVFSESLPASEWAQLFALQAAMSQGAYRASTTAAERFGPYMRNTFQLLRARSAGGQETAVKKRVRASERYGEVVREARRLMESGREAREVAGIIASRRNISRRTVDRALMALRRETKQKKAR